MIFLQLLTAAFIVLLVFAVLRALRNVFDEFFPVGEVPFKTYEQQEDEKNARFRASLECAAKVAYHQGYSEGRATGEVMGRIEGWNEAIADSMKLAREEVARERPAKPKMEFTPSSICLSKRSEQKEDIAKLKTVIAVINKNDQPKLPMPARRKKAA